MLYNYFGKFDDILKISIALDKQNLTMHIISCLLLEKMQQNRHQCLCEGRSAQSPSVSVPVMKRVKTLSCKEMGDEILSALAMVSIH